MFVLPDLDLGGGKGDCVVVNSAQVYGGVALSIELNALVAAALDHHEYQCHFTIVAVFQLVQEVLADLMANDIPFAAALDGWLYYGNGPAHHFIDLLKAAVGLNSQVIQMSTAVNVCFNVRFHFLYHFIFHLLFQRRPLYLF
jgi:hypothetical protein